MENRAERRPPAAESNPIESPAGGSAPDSASFLKALDRKDPYVSIPEGSLFIWDGVLDLEVGVISKLSLDGGAFEYFDMGWVMAETGRFDLLTNAGMCISALSYRLLSDEPVEDELSPAPIRTATVRFGPLSPAQKTALETLISIYGNRSAADRSEPLDRSSSSKGSKRPPLEKAGLLA